MGYCIRRFSASPCGTYWQDIRMIPVCFSATLCRPVKVTAMTDIPQVEQGETFCDRCRYRQLQRLPGVGNRSERKNHGRPDIESRCRFASKTDTAAFGGGVVGIPGKTRKNVKKHPDKTDWQENCRPVLCKKGKALLYKNVEYRNIKNQSVKGYVSPIFQKSCSDGL